jgi:capsular polysaccharide biosynthesis protein
VIDPPFKPVTATGPGRFLILIAGTALFIALGAALALGLGILDDRIFRALDIDEVGVPVLAVIPSATSRKVARR